MQDYYFMLRFQDELRNLVNDEWCEQNPEECYLAERRVREGVHTLRKEI
jgi:hypothetical protein